MRDYQNLQAIRFLGFVLDFFLNPIKPSLEPINGQIVFEIPVGSTGITVVIAGNRQYFPVESVLRGLLRQI